jgi:uncharacterized protein (DUF58 family)
VRPAGITAALGAVLLLVAAAFDAEPLFVGGAAFLLLGAFSAAWVVVGAAGIGAERSVGARTVVEGTAVDVRVKVTAGHVGRLPTGVVDDELLAEPAPLRLGAPATALRIRAIFDRRGRRILGPTRVVVRDPAGLAERVVEAGEPVEVLVLPRISPVTAPGGEGEPGTVGSRAGRPQVAAEVELDGLRPLRPGAPASRIHWSAWARTGELLERRLRADADSRALVVLDPRGADTHEDLDAAVRAAGSLCQHLARQGGCAVLLPGDRRPSSLDPSLAGWGRLHVRLALVTGEQSPSVAGLAGRRGPVIYVAAKATARPPRALAHAVGGGRVLVVPGTIPGRRPAFAVAGCTGYALRESSVKEAA